MTRAEEAALEHSCALCDTDVRHCGLRKSPGINCKDCNLFILGYEQAEKDLALSWEDIPKLIELTGKTFRHYCDTGRPDVLLQELYEDVLRRFKEAKK